MMLFADLFISLPWIALGVCVGIIVGAVPGLTGAMVIALAVPLTFTMDEADALALLVSLYTGSVSGGLISATLLKIPGTPASMITILDAHPMAEAGQAGRALGIGITASLFGGLFSGLALVLLAKPVAAWSIYLGPYDLFALVFVALIFIIAVAEPGRVGMGKGILAGCIGVAISLPGVHPATGEIRYTFGIAELNDGFNLLPVLIGLFAFSQAWKDLTATPGKIQSVVSESLRITLPFSLWIKQVPNLIRSSAIGTFVGILPGIGANVGSVISYGAAKHLSREPERFGKGSEEGLIASESANNATVGGALIPLISLGIPGSVIDAILIGAFVIHGLQPGPLLFQNHPETVQGLLGAYLVSNLIMAIVMLAGIRWIARLGGVSKLRLAPIILLCCVAGSYCTGNRLFDVWIMVAFGVVGLILERYRIPPAPLVIGFVLAPLAEENLAAGLMIHGGSYAPLFYSPFPIICFCLAALLIILSVKALTKTAPPAETNGAE
ncbi:MAG: tripartite tricarboxylate transporter permease [Verrucomicrobiales bacterium]|nr:tripartite tricarboxylate transporter permease [Verrucomicrobiales bacterium]